jgi:hypothetical protein
VLPEDVGGRASARPEWQANLGQVHVVASEPHFLDHLAPLYSALPEQARGGLWTGTSGNMAESTVLRARELGLEVDGAHPPAEAKFFLVSSHGDMLRVNRLGVVAYAEHGCGMTWSGAGDGSYVGSRDRAGVSLILCPNERTATIQRRYTPALRVVDLGSEPRLDHWCDAPRPVDGPVCVSFHWDADVVPETKTCLYHYRRVLVDLAKQFDVIGHSHPRIWGAASAVYAAAGIEPVQRFDEVMERAGAYVCDVSSTMYEFAATDRPVVALNRPEYRRDVWHGLRFWELVPGLQCDSPDDLAGVVAQALRDAPEHAWLRRRAVSAVFPRNDGNASHRGAQALLEWMRDAPSAHPESVMQRMDTWVVVHPDGVREEYLVAWEANGRAAAVGGRVEHLPA